MTNDLAARWAGAFLQRIETNLSRVASKASRSSDPSSMLVAAMIAALDDIHRALSENPSLHQDIAALDREAPLTPRILSRAMESALDHRAVKSPRGLSLEPDVRARKASGSYYTPPSLVDLLIERALLPVLTDRVRAAAFENLGEDDPLPPLAKWPEDTRQRAKDAILRLRVLDPACGSGDFLVPAGERLADQLARLEAAGEEPTPAMVRRARRDVFARVLHGVDKDERAVRAAKLAFWLSSGRPKRPIDSVARGLEVGDSLGVDERDVKPTTRPVERFDVVLGNPPFANAIEGLVSPRVKEALAARFKELSGTADLAYYFLALSDGLCKADGAIGLVLPRGVLTSPSARRLRRRLRAERPPTLIYSPAPAKLFSGANVYVVALALARGAEAWGGRGDVASLRPLRVVDDNWWAPLLADAGSHEPRIADRPAGPFEIFASMTAGMAYDLVPFVTDSPIRGAARLATTGLIDPGVCRWSKRACRYLKRDYRRPVIDEAASMPASLKTRLAKVRRPKILVAGLADRIEAFLDRRGHYAGAVSTYTIVHPANDLAALAELADFLNGPEATRRLHVELGAHAMGGGRITLTKEFLRSLFSSWEG